MKNKFNKSKSHGFTLVELVVVITIIGILSTIVVFSFTRVQINARDSQRSSKIAIIASALEKYYSQNGEYPSCADITQDSSTVVTNTLVGVGQDVLSTPSSETNSFVCNTPNSDGFGYIGGGAQYTLEYLNESTDSVVSIASQHTPLIIDSPSAPTINVALVDSNATATITEVSCTTGTPQYGIRNRINDGTWGTYPVWSTGLTSSQLVTGQGIKYGFQAQARCYGSSVAYSNNIAGVEASYTGPISTPATTSVTASTPNTTTTWSWSAVSCSAGTTIKYVYNYYISNGYNVWVETDNTSFSANTSTQGYTYYLTANARCYTSATTSDWSTASNTVGYYRPMTYSLSIASGAGGSVNTGVNGTYYEGTTPTITATPSTYYQFSEWSGSAGCAGTASHTITMDANKTCTANFVATPVSAPAAPTVSASTSGSTTTWSWTAPSCQAGATVTYVYRYYASNGYDSWVETSGNSASITTSAEGYTYYLYVHARCYTPAISSGWGDPSNTVSYYRPMTYSLSIASGAGGSVNTGVNGTYTAGTVVTITAVPSGYYAFSSWSGSTGCSGAYSHTITMDANKSCTANFTLDANWLAVGTQVWAKANQNVGTMIASVTNQTNNAILEKYCYNNTESNCTTYGGLYQWNEVMQYVTTNGAQGICPTGSHIPTDNDWKILEVQLGMTQAQADISDAWRGTDQGTKLKSGGSSGLNMPLAGHRDGDGSFDGLSSYANLWSSSESSANAWGRNLDWDRATVGRNTNDKGYGFPVRCLGN